MKAWNEPQPIQPPQTLIRVAGHPLVAQVLARRGMDTPAAARSFLDPNAYTPAPPSDLPDLPAAAERLTDAIRRGEHILVWGDFDVDGQTATSLLVWALHELGASASAYIPNRLREGHGIRLASLQNQLASVEVLLTCDTGVAEYEAITYARERGVAVLVTDHHDIPPELPPANAVVDPKRLSEAHPLRELPGVGVAFKLLQQVFFSLGASPGKLESALDLVALGIVADVATQTGDTRYLLQRGMPRLRQTHRMGLQALMQMAQVNPAHLTTDHIGFNLGPRLNALGRLGDANLAVELLTTTDMSRARILAAQLEALNSRRRVLTSQIYAAAQEQIASEPALLDRNALVLSGPHWHPGVIGIVASRLVETYGRPTALISEGDDGEGRGSARSIPGVDIHAALRAVADLLTTHGGHPTAAGFSLSVERITPFRDALSRAVDKTRDRGVARGLTIDVALPWHEASLELVETLNALAPFGKGNPPVVLASHQLELVSEQIFGRNLAHRRLTVRDADGTAHDVIWWRGAEHPLPTGLFDLAYQLKASDYRGERQLQIEYVDARVVSPLPVTVVTPAVQVVDHRAAPDPLLVLEALRTTADVIIWAEGYAPNPSPGLRRDQLEAAPTLVIWTPPPGPRELRAALERVSPQTVHLFAATIESLDPRNFVPRLAGLIKYTLRQKTGIADLAELAASSAQRLESVREGIYLLQARGDVQIVDDQDATMLLGPGDGRTRPELDQIQAHLQALLQETAAYRAFFGRTAPERLI